MIVLPGRLATGSWVRRRQHIAWLVASVSTLGVCGAAGAQTRETTPLEEVIVTAQKHSQRLQDVPIAITVLGGGELDAFTGEGVSEALTLVPGLATTESVQSGGTQLAMRGVAAGGPLFSGSSPIAYYLDSVPFGLIKTAITPDSNPYDLDRIEVLRGPQGTLYGASAQNGVVRVLTKDANLEDFELKARTSLSSTEDGTESYRGDVAVNVPVIAGKLGIRAVAGYDDQGGWIDRPTGEDANDAQISNFRFKANAQPTDSLSIGLSAWLSRGDYGAPSFADDQGRNAATMDESISADYDLYGLRVVYDFAAFTLTSSTGYIDYQNDSALDLLPFGAPGLALSTVLDSEVLSEELILSSEQNETWRWSLGGMYRDGEDRLDALSQVGACRDRRTKHVPGGHVRNAVIRDHPRRLGALARALRAEEQEVHADYRRKPS